MHIGLRGARTAWRAALLTSALVSVLVPPSLAAASGPEPTRATGAAYTADDVRSGDGMADTPAGEQDDLARGTGPDAAHGDSPGTATTSAGRPEDFQLRSGANLGNLVSLLTLGLHTQGLTALMGQADRQAQWNTSCGNGSALYGPVLTPNRRACWTDDDATSTEWIPQAITGVSDAQEDENWGNSPADPVAVASYDAENPGRAEYHPDDNCQLLVTPEACNEKGVRVSFINQQTGRYRHVLLVWPYENSHGHASFDALHAKEASCPPGVQSPECRAQDGIHAGGMTWYGNYLYVADTSNGLRVFDMRHILDLDHDQNPNVHDRTPDGLVSNVLDTRRVGRQNNVWYSYGYRYVMPQVATLHLTATPPSGTSGNRCYTTGRPKVSFVALDRTGTDHLSIGEYCNTDNGGNSPGRIGTYPMASVAAAVEGAVGTIADADSAYVLPSGPVLGTEPLWHKIQGAVRYEGAWYFHRSNAHSKGRLLKATVSGGVLVPHPVALESSIGPEDLYLAHGRGNGIPPELWSVSEHAPSVCGPCKREVYSYPMSTVTAGFGQ
ncbi:hypothetical protein ACWEFL_20150 [Streptomyces sp. NPDC004838]